MTAPDNHMNNKYTDSDLRYLTSSEIRMLVAAFELMIKLGIDDEEAWDLSYDVLWVECVSEWSEL